MRAKEIWEAAEKGARSGDTKSANVMRLYALGQMLAQAETAVLTNNDAEAAEHLRELQAHAERLIGLLAPGHKVRPTLVVAA